LFNPRANWSLSLQPEPVCEIKVLTTDEELVESYRLRYEVYGGLGYIRTTNRAKLEIDEYDPFSIPFGAFVGGKLAGTLRLILNEKQPEYVEATSRVLSQVADTQLIEQASRLRRHPLPSIISTRVMRQIERFNVDRFPVRELSRTIVHADHRGAGVSRGLMELGLAISAQRGPAVLIGGCLAEHVPMYAKYGYVELPDTERDLYDSVGQVAHAVVCRTDVLPQPTRGHVDKLLRRMQSGADTCTLDTGRGLKAIHHIARQGEGRARRS
jgi:predicted GNAT family N-acyltransferase